MLMGAAMVSNRTEKTALIQEAILVILNAFKPFLSLVTEHTSKMRNL